MNANKNGDVYILDEINRNKDFCRKAYEAFMSNPCKELIIRSTTGCATSGYEFVQEYESAPVLKGEDFEPYEVEEFEEFIPYHTEDD